MKIIEIIVGDQETPIDDNFLPPHRIPDQNLMAHIANAFTPDGAVKLLWDLDVSSQSPEPEATAISQEQIVPLAHGRSDPVR